MTLSLREQAGAGRKSSAPADPDDEAIELEAISEAETELEEAKKARDPKRIRAARKLLRDLYDE